MFHIDAINESLILKKKVYYFFQSLPFPTRSPAVGMVGSTVLVVTDHKCHPRSMICR